MRRARWSFVIAALLAPTAALAQPDADRAQARALASDAQSALDKKDYGTAADRFARAESMIHAPTLLLGLAEAQLGLGKLVSAQETLTRIVREGVAPGAPPAFAKAVSDAKKELEALAPRVPTLTIQVKGASSPAVTIDGAAVPSAALGAKRPVDPGKRVVRATADGMAPAEASVTLAEGANESVTIELTALSGPAAAQPGAPSDDKPRAPAAAAGTASSSSNQKLLGAITLGLGAAGLIVGGVTGALAASKHSTLVAAPIRSQADVDSYKSMGLVSTIGFIGGGVLAAAGVVVILTAPKRAPATGMTLSPFIGLGRLGATGTF